MTKKKAVLLAAALLVLVLALAAVYFLTLESGTGGNKTIEVQISYDDVLAQHLSVMDSTATSLSMDNKIPVLLFALKDPQNIIRALCGEKVGTIVGE